MIVSAIAVIVTAISAMFLYYNILKDQIFADLKAYAHIIEQIDFDELKGDISGSMRMGIWKRQKMGKQHIIPGRMSFGSL